MARSFVLEPDLDAGLARVDPFGQFFPFVYVRVGVCGKDAFQVLDGIGVEVGAGSACTRFGAIRNVDDYRVDALFK